MNHLKYLKYPLALLVGAGALSLLLALATRMMPLLERSLGANPHVSYIMLLTSGAMLLGTGLSVLRTWQFHPTQLLELGLPLLVLGLGYRNLGKFQDPAVAMNAAAKLLGIIPRHLLEIIFPFALPFALLGAFVGACALALVATMLVMRLRVFRA